jgi:hypothetical protein
MAGGPGGELAGDGLPVTAGTQDMQDAVEDPTEGHDGTPRRPQGFLLRQQRCTLGPEGVWHPPDGGLGFGIIVTGHGIDPPTSGGCTFYAWFWDRHLEAMRFFAKTDQESAYRWTRERVLGLMGN